MRPSASDPSDRTDSEASIRTELRQARQTGQYGNGGPMRVFERVTMMSAMTSLSGAIFILLFYYLIYCNLHVFDELLQKHEKIFFMVYTKYF
jgi:hypothetical protein